MKLYTIINGRQPGMLGGVQAGHAIAELSFHYAQNDWIKDFFMFGQGPFVFLKGPNTHEKMQELFLQIADLIEPLEIPIHGFFEPDLNNTMTAISFIVPTPQELDVKPIHDLFAILDTFHTAR